MKFYLASNFHNKDIVARLATELNIKGHYVPDVWWNINARDEGPKDNLEWNRSNIALAIANRHFKCIRECDALILVANDGENSYNGANVEVGYALGRGIPVFSVGNIPKSAMYVPVIMAKTIEELLDLLSIFSLSKR